MTVRRPRLLGADMAETGRLEPSAMSVTMPLRDAATASVTLPASMAGIGMHAWAEIYTARGSAGLFRVTDLTKTSRGETQIMWRHGIDTLSDDVWAAQTDYDGTVAGYLAALLAQQTTARWQLGRCDDAAAWKRSGINYTRLSDLLAELIQEREDFYLEYDFSTSPWTLSFRALPQTVSAEFRLSRNVETATINRNDTDLCNRLYLSVNTATTEDGVTTNEVELRTYDNAASQAVYGIVSKTADIDTADVADADAWAADFLARRAEPAVQITIDGLELAALTGDSWDEYDRGRLVRMAFGDMGETATERVESVTYPDVLGEPERVTVELANRLDAFTETIAQLERDTARAGRAARAAGRNAASGEELKYWAMVVRDTDLENLYLSGIEIDAQSGVRIYSLTQGFVSQYAELKVNSQEISTLVRKTGVNDLGQDETLYSKVTQTATDITTLVSKTGINSLGQNETLYSQIRQTATDITSLVTKTGVNSLGQNETLYSKVTQTATDITSLVNKTGVNSLGQNETLYSKVTQTATDITSLVTKTGVNSLGPNETLFSKVTQTATDITSVVNKTGISSLGQNETLYSKITQNATEISQKVSAGDIASEINQTAQTVRISASKINLDGYVTASDLSATNATITNLTSGSTQATHLKGTTLSAVSTFSFRGFDVTYEALSLRASDGTTVSKTFLVRV